MKNHKCHINVEYYASFQTMKYLFKYQYKGHDSVGAGLQNQDNKEETNEIKIFQTRQYNSAYKVSWHVYEYKMRKLIPSAMKLKVHLKDEHSAIHNHDIYSVRRALKRNKQTQLNEYFKINDQDEEATEHKYE